MSHSKMNAVENMPTVESEEVVENKPIKNTTAQTAKKMKAIDSAESKSDSVAGVYYATVDLNMRHGAGMHKNVMVVIPKNTRVRNHGYYTVSSGINWLYVQVVIDGTIYSGFCSSDYLSKI